MPFCDWQQQVIARTSDTVKWMIQESMKIRIKF